ncbi:MAG: hypothetical protein BM559_02010 [Roseobacter sp. MedPE-SWchi]|nr:MAG: hypothetical protein BM559_02010 [Roseobacter sp. MedPE-SWchi]
MALHGTQRNHVETSLACAQPIAPAFSDHLTVQQRKYNPSAQIFALAGEKALVEPKTPFRGSASLV